MLPEYAIASMVEGLSANAPRYPRRFQALTASFNNTQRSEYSVFFIKRL